MNKAPALLTEALGYEVDEGKHHCFYCGAECDGSRGAAIKPTFTEYTVVAQPSSNVRCLGCELAMREKVDMPGRDKPQKMRNYSWLIMKHRAVPLNKSDVGVLRAHCLNPPDPPFALTIATSGQKHVLFHTPVCFDTAAPVVCLEGEPISYRPEDLHERLRLTGSLVAATGKPALAGRPGVRLCSALMDRYGEDGVKLYEAWQRVWCEPLSQLARFLAPPKKEAQHEHPARDGTKEHAKHGLFPA